MNEQDNNLDKQKFILTPEQNKILEEITSILKLEDNVDAVPIYEKRFSLVQPFRKEMIEKIGIISLSKYLLWHKFIGSTPKDDNFDEFDIPLSDKDLKEEQNKKVEDRSVGYIERFIRTKVKDIK